MPLEFFKRAWDETMAETHGVNWGGLFAQIVQKLLDDIIAGETDALSLFMEKEKQRVLGVVPALVIPAARVVVGDFNMELESESESAVAE